MLKDHNTVTPVRLGFTAPRSGTKHSTTEPLRSLSPTVDNGQQSNSIQDPTETALEVGTNTECSQLDNTAANIIKTHEEIQSMNAHMVETLSKVYEFAEKLV